MSNRIDHHPLTGETTLVTPNRLDRPNALLDHDGSDHCPFCPGHEDETPPEIERIEADGGWLIRVIPNKYPIASPDIGIKGAHEVIVESPNHDDELRTLPISHMRSLVDVWLRRTEHISTLESVRSVILLRNRGVHAGESIRHPHTQVIGLSDVPARIGSQRRSSWNCDLCQPASRLEITSNQSFRVVAAEAARFPHQCWIVPRFHAATPSLAGSTLSDFASIIQRVESLLHHELGEISLNWYLIEAPIGETEFHWYVEVSPRLTGIAGLELATGWFVNLIPPEESAERLRTRAGTSSPTPSGPAR